MGGSNKQTNTTQVQLSPQQQEILDLAMPGLKQFAANPPQLPDFSRVAGFDPSQTLGQEQALNAAGSQQTTADAGANAFGFLANPDILDPNSNPYLAGTIDAAVRPIQENLVTSTLPAIRSDFVNSGQYGGSRQGIAEGLASRSANQAIADTGASVANEGYRSGLQALASSLGYLPNVMQGLVQPAATTSAVGDVRQAQAQAQLDERASDFSYEQTSPYLVASDLISLVNGIPGATTTSTATGPKQSPLSSILGALSLGAGILGAPILGAGTLGASLFA